VLTGTCYNELMRIEKWGSQNRPFFYADVFLFSDFLLALHLVRPQPLVPSDVYSFFRVPCDHRKRDTNVVSFKSFVYPSIHTIVRIGRTQ